MRVSLPLKCVIAFAVGPLLTSAAAVEFPYKAVVEHDDLPVRSGPGERYDPTLKLKSGQQVTVHKHEPGGWFMISPPPGSFSWIDAAYVERTGPETGVVQVPRQDDGLPQRVAVWIGSQFTDEHRYYGRQLASGDEVRILDEKTSASEGGPASYFKIAPPRHEYRWVKGDFIVPLSDTGRIVRSQPVQTPTISASPQQADPFANSFSAEQTMAAPGFPPEQTSTLVRRELMRDIDSAAVHSSEAASETTTAQRTRLHELDAQLKAMVAQTPDHWDLAGIQHAYRELQAAAGAVVRAQIESRLAAIESRKRIKAEYDAFVSVTTRTQQRDAELLSMQQSIASGIPLSPIPVELGRPTAFPLHVAGGGLPQPATATSPVPVPQAANPRTQATVPQMDGAGVVQRVPRPQLGLPQHALVAPDGRLLAYLQAGQGVRLDSYVGQSMGVIGRRSHDSRLRADLIVVERLTPVQLQP